jgi:hypothetical protein
LKEEGMRLNGNRKFLAARHRKVEIVSVAPELILSAALSSKPRFFDVEYQDFMAITPTNVLLTPGQSPLAVSFCKELLPKSPLCPHRHSEGSFTTRRIPFASRDSSVAKAPSE